MEKYGVTVKNHLLQLRYLIFNFLFFLLIPIFFYFIAGRESVVFGVKFMLIAQTLFFVPCLILHLRYMYLNGGITLFFVDKEKSMIVRLNGKEKIYPLFEVERIESFKTISEVRASPWSAPWQNYSFSKIYFKSGENIVVTSLLVPGLKWPMVLPNENLTTRLLFCWA